jgi:hypothetical protein
MVNDRNIESTTATSGTRSRSSKAAKLVQAAALAAVLVPLGSVTAEASTCTFNFSGSPSCGIVGAGADGFGFFGFVDPTYKVALAFDEVIGQFDVTITATELTEAEALAKMSAFPGFRPVPIGNNLEAPFIDFNVSAPAPCTTDAECGAPGTNTWRSDNDPGTRGPGVPSGYELRVYWLADTDSLYPDPHLLHATGASELYDIDITDPNFPYTTIVPCEVFDACESTGFAAFVDPAAGGRDDMFTTFGLGDATNAVPEPASLLLLGSGIGGWLYRRRRQK